MEFNDDLCMLFADIIKQDIGNVKVLFYIAQCMQTATPVTVKTITDNVKIARRVGVKNADNTLVAFANQDTHIDRKTAERIVDRLAYASLINYEVQHPHKFIKLTDRGVQVAIHIKQNMEVTNNG